MPSRLSIVVEIDVSYSVSVSSARTGPQLCADYEPSRNDGGGPPPTPDGEASMASDWRPTSPRDWGSSLVYSDDETDASVTRRTHRINLLWNEFIA
jgi:hypothetical protein